MFHIFKKEGKDEKHVDSLTVYIVIGTIIGARLGHVIFYDLHYYLTHPSEIIKIWHGGLASHGGAIGILIALYLFCRKYKYNYLWLLDRLVIVACITGGFIRLGNLMNSEIIGIPSRVPWAFIFTSVDNQPRHPSQLYESLFCFILLPILFYLWKKKRKELANGFLFGIFMVALWAFRFLVEYVKVDQSAFEKNLPLDMGQILSIPFFFIGVYFLWRAIKKTPRPQAS